MHGFYEFRVFHGLLVQICVVFSDNCAGIGRLRNGVFSLLRCLRGLLSFVCFLYGLIALLDGCVWILRVSCVSRVTRSNLCGD